MKDGLFNDSLVIWKWKARHRSWQREAETWACSRAVVLIDPLVPLKKRNDTAKKSEVKQSEIPEFADPLGATVEDHKKNTVFTEDLSIFSKRKEEPKLANTLVSKEEEIIIVTEKI
ncbi:unnamed protein product [Onchocerca flexuosa]|uniref:Uncharacterized protein n=1 Tax=Onchocerca flexuosa TaxID=387005 RepID=A0A183HSK5_9BILA|nr:unnamed protein product [Onchocerca flexuosa]